MFCLFYITALNVTSRFGIVSFVFSIWSKFKLSNFSDCKQIEIKILTPQTGNPPSHSVFFVQTFPICFFCFFFVFFYFGYLSGDFVAFSAELTMTTICCFYGFLEFFLYRILSCAKEECR